MELEFDKEIDAILRRSRGGEGAGGNGAAATHLDADAIVAFVENAVPDSVRRSYTSHFADCMRCRKLLSQTILMNDSAVGGTDRTVVPGVTDVIASVPWYAKIFRTPGLAVAMGALVITFSGVLGYLVLRDSGDAANSTVSQINEQPAAVPGNGPYFDGGVTEPTAMNSNANRTSTNTMANTAVVSNATNAAGITSNTAAAAPVDMLSTRQQESVAATRDMTLDGVKLEAKPMAAAPPPAAVTGGAAGADRDKKSAEERRAEDEKAKEVDSKDDASARKLSDAARMRRDAPVAAAKSGPARSGPVQMQSNQVGNIAGEMPVKRMVGGKTFENRQGAWYDQTYRGQATLNYRRSSVEYKSLDGGLRSIADTLGGTVVVVWKGKAYRIN